MAHRKKKPSRESIQKLERVQHKNEFIRRVLALLPYYLEPRQIALIPRPALDYLYMIRFGSPIVAAADGHEIPNEVLKETKFALTEMLKLETIPLYENGPEVPISDYITIAQSIRIFGEKIDETSFPRAGEIKAALVPKIRFDDGTMKSIRRICVSVNVAATQYSNLWDGCYWARLDLILPSNEIKRAQYRVNIYHNTPPQVRIKVDGNTRPAVRVGWNDYGSSEMRWLSFDPKLLSNNASLPSQKLDVYIQAHAIERLRERIDCMELALIHMEVFWSLMDPRVIASGFGYDLIEFRISDMRAGYFVFSIVDGVMLIRTFLFITNNGTPEGAKLQKVTGLGRLDKKYLAIDRLSSFMSSDIGENSMIREIFEQCDCENLLHLYQEIETSSKCTKHSSQKTALLIEKYLQLGKSNEDYCEALGEIFAEQECMVSEKLAISNA